MKTLADLVKETSVFAVEDLKKTWRLFFVTVLAFAAVTTFTFLDLPFGVRLLASFMSGLVLVRIFIFYHDYLHGAVFRRSRMGAWIMDLYGLYILNPPNVWKRSHNYHHQHNAQIATASIGSFPVMTVKQYQGASFAKRALYRFSRSPLVMIFGYLFIFLIGMCSKSFLTDPKRHFDSLVAIVLHFIMLFGMVTFFGWETAFLSFLFPIMVACALGAYLFYIQHNFPDVKLKPRTEWDFLFAALYASSYMTGPKWLHWFTGNIGYHHVHHLNARIPFYRLPEAMAAIPELQNPGRTSLSPVDIYRCFRLKLWNPDLNRMVHFGAAH